MAAVTYRQALHDTLRAEMLRDENILLIGEEIGVFEGSYKITAGLLDEFGPRRVRDTPICEEGFVGAAVGAAMLGLRPVVEIMTINFSLLAIDQIVNHAAKMHAMFGGQVSVPMVIRTPGGAGSNWPPPTRRTWRSSTRTCPDSRSSPPPARRTPRGF